MPDLLLPHATELLHEDVLIPWEPFPHYWAPVTACEAALEYNWFKMHSLGYMLC